ncbi:hypothetical protein [Saccharothrix stipae]
MVGDAGVSGKDFNEEQDESSAYGPLGVNFDPQTGLFSADGEEDAKYDSEFPEELAEEFGETQTEISIGEALEDDGTYAAPPSAQNAINTGFPVLLLTRPHRDFNLIPPILRMISRQYGSTINLAASTSLIRIGPSNGDAFLASCSPAALRIADPVAFASHDNVPGRSPAAPKNLRWPYQQHGTLTSNNEDAWIAEVIAAQRAAGANIILSPGRYLAGDDIQLELDTAIRQAESTAGQVSKGEPSALNLTLGTSWVTNPAKRDNLLERLIEYGPSLVFVRVLWPRLDTAAQPVDPALLIGYKEMCEVAVSEGIRLIFPNTDLTGWLTLSWGSTGFGTGIYAEARAFTTTQRGGPTPNIKARFLEGELLHTILRDEHESLVRLSHVSPCLCKFCAIAGNGYPWPILQASHHVLEVARLTSLMPTPRNSNIPAARTKVAKTHVTSAQRLYKKAIKDIAFEAGSMPKHLASWQSVL